LPKLGASASFTLLRTGFGKTWPGKNLRISASTSRASLSRLS